MRLETLTVLFLLAALGVLATPALAHPDLVTTDPIDGAVVSEPVDQIELVFSDEVEPVGSGVRMIDSSRQPLETLVFQPTPSSVVVAPATTLPDGAYTVVWQLGSRDSHVLFGSVSFTVQTRAGGSALPEPGTTPGTPSPESVPSPSAATTLTVATPGPDAANSAPIEAPILVDLLGFVGRWAVIAGALLAIGAFAFAATSLIGTEEEVQRAVRWAGLGGVLVIAGTLIEFVGVSTSLAGSWSAGLSSPGLMEAIGSQTGIAMFLRLAGGVALLQDPRLVTVSAGLPVADASRLSDGPGRQTAALDVAVAPEPSQARYRFEVQHEWVALVGMAAVGVSFMFDGHTLTGDPSAVARASTLVHVVFAGVWLGGVVVMANILARRWRAAVPLDASAMALRFSRVAAVSLVLVAVAGAALAWTIVDSPSDLVSGAWGRLLILKVSLVAIAAALGAYNHFKVIPQLDAVSDNVHASRLLRRVVAVEAGVLLAVAAGTAILVRAPI